MATELLVEALLPPESRQGRRHGEGGPETPASERPEPRRRPEAATDRPEAPALSTALEDHVSIFLLAFEHRICLRLVDEWSDRLAARHWIPHPYYGRPGKPPVAKTVPAPAALRGARDSSGIAASRPCRAFSPQEILTPTAVDAILGGDALRQDELPGDRDFLARLLTPDDPDCRGTRTVLLTLDAEARVTGLATPFEISLPEDPRAPATTVRFTLDWADLWVFPDNSAVLACKANLLAARVGDNPVPLTLDHLSLFNRAVRAHSSWQPGASVKVTATESPLGTVELWRDLIYRRWLGFGSDTDVLLMEAPPASSVERLVGRVRRVWGGNASSPLASPFADSGSLRGPADRASPADAAREVAFHRHIDRYTRYAKLLTAAQIPSVEEGAAELWWNQPQLDLPRDLASDLASLRSGRWTLGIHASQAAIAAGYPTAGEHLLYDYATTSTVGTTRGDRGRGWQPNADYVRAAIGNGLIKIWEYWRGLALHDVCAFLAYDASMPVVRSKRDGASSAGQVESRYYALYVHTYHLKYRLHRFSDEVIDWEMMDIARARQVLERFERFRNQFWFQEVTVDFQGVEVVDRMKRGMKIDALYGAVMEEVKDVSEFVDRKMSAGGKALLGVVILALAPLKYLWESSGLGPVLLELAQTRPGLVATLAATTLLLLAGLAPRVAPRLTALYYRLGARLWQRGSGA